METGKFVASRARLVGILQTLEKMAIAKTYSAGPWGVDGFVVDVEAAGHSNQKSMLITGLPGDVVKESRERIRACLVNLGFRFPRGKVVVHLSPASQRKQGSQFDLAIAIAVLTAEKHLAVQSLESFAFLGELSLQGHVKKISHAVGLIQALVKKEAIRHVFVPAENESEASWIESSKIRVVSHLREILDFFHNKILPRAPVCPPRSHPEGPTSLDRVQGQSLGKRALQIALAGGHHLILIGSPGVGKSMLARCAPALLPPLDKNAYLEVLKCQEDGWVSLERPFRFPHHSISYAGLLGGGSGIVVPGEVTRAHQGVLFLDELGEFRRDALEGLREPLEQGRICLTRVGQALSLPARFTLLAAMNPCPCGSARPDQHCQCTYEQLSRYRRKLSGPLWDRLDLGVFLNVPVEGTIPQSLSHEAVRLSIERVWNLRKGRSTSLQDSCYRLGLSERNWLTECLKKENLSYRARDRILRVARTIADLEAKDGIEKRHLMEAWSLKCPHPFLIPSPQFSTGFSH